jgi:uncharacterized protein
MNRKRMPTNNALILYHFYDAWDAGDLRSCFGALSREVLVTYCGPPPWNGTLRGHASLRSVLERLRSQLDVHLELERLIKAGDRLAAIGRASGSVRATGRPFEAQFLHFWEFRSGLALRLEIAVEATGVEQALAGTG